LTEFLVVFTSLLLELKKGTNDLNCRVCIAITYKGIRAMVSGFFKPSELTVSKVFEYLIVLLEAERAHITNRELLLKFVISKAWIT
jgi:hypothetical protein